MPLCYPRRTGFCSRLLEGLAFVLLWPWLRSLSRRNAAAEKWIVLVEPFGMGDALSLSVTLDLLREHLADHKLCLWLKQENADLYAGDARVARVETAPFPWSRLSRHKRGSWADWRAVWASAQRLRALRPELGIDTRSEIRSQLLLVLAGCRRRVGYRNYLNSNLDVRGLLLTQAFDKAPAPAGTSSVSSNRELPPEQAALHRYDMNRQLVARYLQVTPPPLVFPTFGRELPAVAGRAVVQDTPHPQVILIHPGARWAYNRWPAVQWAELIAQLRLLPGMAVELIGGAGEAALLNEIVGRLETPVACRTTELPGLKDALAGASLVLCMDSGPMHMADTLGTPVLALFGPGDVDLWHPRGARDRWLHVRYTCNPCLQKTCVRPEQPCIRAIGMEQVLCAVREILTNTRLELH